MTIANQDKQIRLLTERIVHLTNRNTELERIVAEAHASCNSLMDQSNEFTLKLHGQLADLREANTRMLGWQDCAREMIVVRE